VTTKIAFPDDIETMLLHIDEIGGREHENHYPVGWCWAGSSPLKRCRLSPCFAQAEFDCRFKP
jgi:hypothetical protein